jgi:glycosyltransferase involved in cell wall biosynthesis
MEGCSKEVFALKDHFLRSHVFGFSRYYGIRASLRQRYLGLNFIFYPLFRLLAPLLEVTTDINHIYGSLGEWFFLRVLRRRPTIMTIATETTPFGLEMYARVARFVTHSTSTTEEMIRLGFDPARITRIYPGVDLSRFHPGPRASALPQTGAAPDAARFRILYATAPNWAEGLKLKGVELMIEAARRLPAVDFYLLWRPWADADRLVSRLVVGKPDNVHVSVHLVANMTEMFQSADATIAPFLKRAGTKICPTSLIESLACGKPLLVSTEVGIYDVVRDEQCGVVFEPTVDALCDAVEHLRTNHARFAAQARPCAERLFDQTACLLAHERLYEEVRDFAEAT